MPTLCPFLTVPCWVGRLQPVVVAFLGHISFLQTYIIIDDNTIVLHKIEL